MLNLCCRSSSRKYSSTYLRRLPAASNTSGWYCKPSLGSVEVGFSGKQNTIKKTKKTLICDENFLIPWWISSLVFCKCLFITRFSQVFDYIELVTSYVHGVTPYRNSLNHAPILLISVAANPPPPSPL